MTRPPALGFAASVFIFCLAAFPPQTGATPPSVPWKAGERLTFDVSVGLLAAGEASLEVHENAELEFSTNGVTKKYTAYHFVSSATTNAFVDVFYKVRDRSDSWLDTTDLVSHRFEQHNEEGKYRLEQTVQYDWINKHFVLVDAVRSRGPKTEEGALPIPVVDILSALYLTRTKNLEAGKDFTLDVHSGKIYPLGVKVYPKETVKVKAGTFECFVVEPFLMDRGLFIQKGKKLKVWLTADARRMPVKMQAEIFIGHVTAELAEFSQ